jgi:hypothetical protein
MLPPHPDPPHDLDQHDLPIRHIDPSTNLFRIHAIHNDPLYFSSTGINRFDAPHAQYGILYVGSDEHTAFIETFGRDPSYRLVTRTELEARGLARVTTSRSLRVVDLTGPGLARLGADSRLVTGDYPVAQRWSLALWAHPVRPDGLVWRSRFDPSRTCVAIYDRAAEFLTAVPWESLLDAQNGNILAAILDTYGFGYLDT